MKLNYDELEPYLHLLQLTQDPNYDMCTEELHEALGKPCVGCRFEIKSNTTGHDYCALHQLHNKENVLDFIELLQTKHPELFI